MYAQGGKGIEKALRITLPARHVRRERLSRQQRVHVPQQHTCQGSWLRVEKHLCVGAHARCERVSGQQRLRVPQRRVGNDRLGGADGPAATQGHACRAAARVERHLLHVGAEQHPPAALLDPPVCACVAGLFTQPVQTCVAAAVPR